MHRRQQPPIVVAVPPRRWARTALTVVVGAGVAAVIIGVLALAMLRWMVTR